MSAAVQALYAKGDAATAADATLALNLAAAARRTSDLVAASLLADDRPRHPEVKFSAN